MLRLAAALVPVALVACVDSGDEGMYVLNNTAVGSESCSLSGSPDQPFISHGVIYYGSSFGYLLTPLIQSRITASETDTDQAQKTIQLRGADVTLTLKAMSVQAPDGSISTSQSETQLGQFSSLFAGAVTPGGSVNVGVDIIPPATLRSIADMSGADLANGAFTAEVLASIVIKGDINGSSIESTPYLYPVSVCSDCVVSVLGACPLPTGAEVRGGNACNPFQDGVVDCCVDGEDLVCPGIVSTL